MTRAAALAVPANEPLAAAGHVDPADVLDPVRVRGGAAVSFKARGDRTVPGSVYEHGGYRVLFPSLTSRTEAVIINTGGGMVGGDRIKLDFAAGERANAVVTSQAAERIYRSLGPATSIEVSLKVGEGASLLWLPQETILFQQARLARRLEADVAETGSLLVSEICVFGREAMGEDITDGAFRDDWRIRRAGRLVFAEALALDGAIRDRLQRPAVTAGRRVVATLLLVSPDAADRLDLARTALARTDAEQNAVQGGASSWNELLLVRMIGEKSEAVRQAVARVATAVTGAVMPRVWAT